jgi:hypothetical protein
LALDLAIECPTAEWTSSITYFSKREAALRITIGGYKMPVAEILLMTVI